MTVPEASTSEPCVSRVPKRQALCVGQSSSCPTRYRGERSRRGLEKKKSRSMRSLSPVRLPTMKSIRSLSPKRCKSQHDSDAESGKSNKSFLTKTSNSSSTSTLSSKSPTSTLSSKSRDAPAFRSLDLTEHIIHLNKPQPGSFDQEMSALSLFGASDSDLILKTPVEAFNLYRTGTPNIVPAWKDYREAIATCVHDISHAFLSTLALLDIVFRPLMILLWFTVQFAAYRTHHYALCCLKGKQVSKAGDKKRKKASRARGLKREASRRLVQQPDVSETIGSQPLTPVIKNEASSTLWWQRSTGTKSKTPKNTEPQNSTVPMLWLERPQEVTNKSETSEMIGWQRLS